MARLAERFAAFAAAGRKGLLPYVTAGYPSVEATVEVLRRLPAERCLCVELGIPFSDPIADGPVIQTSFVRALEAGFRVDSLFEAVGRARQEIELPLVAMVSYSIVFRRGPQAFVAAAAEAGFDGLIVPDLALEEAERLAAVASKCDCPLVLMVAPTTTAERRQRIAELTSPFIYYQAVAGVTGERSGLPPELPAAVAELRAAGGKPVCVGFGISRPEHVAAVCRVAEGAIVGSAIVRRMNAAVERGATVGALADDVRDCVMELGSALP